MEPGAGVPGVLGVFLRLHLPLLLGGAGGVGMMTSGVSGMLLLENLQYDPAH